MQRKDPDLYSPPNIFTDTVDTSRIYRGWPGWETSSSRKEQNQVDFLFSNGTKIEFPFIIFQERIINITKPLL